MLENILSRNTHYVLSILIPTTASIWFGAGFFAWCLALVCSWTVYASAEMELIHRYGASPAAFSAALRQGVVYAFAGGLFYIGFYMPDSGIPLWQTVTWKVLGLSMIVTAVVGTVFIFGNIMFRHTWNRSVAEEVRDQTQ